MKQLKTSKQEEIIPIIPKELTKEERRKQTLKKKRQYTRKYREEQKLKKIRNKIINYRRICRKTTNL